MLRFFRLFIFILPFGLVLAQSPKSSGDISVLTDLVGLVAKEEPPEPELPQVLAEIVNDYYSETVVPESIPNDVLSYLADIYSEHGYYETGGWAKSRPKLKFVPYKGYLPNYKQGDFYLPIKGRLTSRYGYRPNFGRMHHGIDLALNIGDSVRCALPGIVVKTAFNKGGYGNYVVVYHSGDLQTLYAHLSSTLVKEGEKLNAGEVLGLGGATGNATGPHLHFETRFRGTPFDPLSRFNIFSPIK